MLAGELALAGVDAAIVERRAPLRSSISAESPILSRGQTVRVAGFARGPSGHRLRVWPRASAATRR
jgi:hypothetical protein